MDEQRALLDQLMGTTRDLSEIQKGRVHKIRFSDHDVCKNYLCGLCPHVAFAATKSDMVGGANKCLSNELTMNDGILHITRANAASEFVIPLRPMLAKMSGMRCLLTIKIVMGKKQEVLNRHVANLIFTAHIFNFLSPMISSYERDLLHCLENIVKLCDRKIDKQRQRTDQDLLISEDDVMKIFSLHKQISDCIHQCEECVKEGHIDRIYDLVKQVSQLQESANKIANLPDEKRNLVCETSGNYMSSRYFIQFFFYCHICVSFFCFLMAAHSPGTTMNACAHTLR